MPATMRKYSTITTKAARPTTGAKGNLLPVLAGLAAVTALAFASSAHASSLQTIYTFPSTESGGATVAAGLAVLNGNLYGVATGGSHGAGIIFEFHPVTKTQQTVYNFSGGSKGGAQPTSAHTGVGSKLYGTALSGAGATSGGAAFAFDPAAKKLTLLHGFTDTAGNKGFAPFAPLVYAHGYFYETTRYGGVADAGTIYRLSTTGQYKFLINSPIIQKVAILSPESSCTTASSSARPTPAARTAPASSTPSILQPLPKRCCTPSRPRLNRLNQGC